jgi:RyR domain
MSENDQRSRYQPRPMDTSDVVVPDHLRELSETLAVNAHEVWAAQRMSDGWHYGPSRDDNAKRHPCLVPYDRLPESEKKYDRSMVDQTVRCILKLGYRMLLLDERDGEDGGAAATQR